MSHRNAWVCLGAALILSLSLNAGEGKKGGGPERGGPIAHILEHAKDLKLTPEQVTKLEALQKELAGKFGGGELREKLKDHPELLKELREARESKDETKLAALKEKVREAVMKNGGAGAGEGKIGEVHTKLMEILTPEQLKQVKELMEEARAKFKDGGFKGGPGGKEEKGQKPDTSKEAPKVFE